MKRTIRKACPADMTDIMKVMDAAKCIMRQDGNMLQWGKNYPSESIILGDIERDSGYVIDDDGNVVAYFAFLPSPEPTYNFISGGQWLDNMQPYHVIHRIASYPHVHGVFCSIMEYCFSKESNIRIDTHRDNNIMLHNIEKYGFMYCGIIYLKSGDERLAYQKITIR